MHIPTIQRAGDDAPAPQTKVMPSVERLVPVTAPLAGLVIKGTLLTIITFGIYRFWYRTAIRRYYWHNTTLAGDGFEYTGTGKELFIGFLIALAIFLPLYLVVTLIGLFGGQVLGPIISTIIATLIMPAAVQILIYRARRYRLTRTRYRGVQFHQSGSGVAYLLRTVKWLILTALTLGILLPYFRRALERYKIENTWYGSAQGAFSAPVKPLMKSWLVLWGIGAGVFVLLAMVPLAEIAGSRILAGFGAVFGTIGAFGATILLPLLWVRYRVVEFRTFLAGTTFGEIGLSSDLRSTSVIWVWVRYYLILLGIGLGIVLLGWAFGLGPKPFMQPDPAQILSEGIAGIGILAVGGMLAILATEILFRRRLWALRASSVSVTNLAALEKVIQTAGQDAMGVGEAFDSGFDIAG